MYMPAAAAAAARALSQGDLAAHLSTPSHGEGGGGGGGESESARLGELWGSTAQEQLGRFS